MRNPIGLSLPFVLSLGACDAGDAPAPEPEAPAAASDEPAPPAAAPASATAPKGGPQPLEMKLAPAALPTAGIEASAFLADPCTLVSKEELGKFLAYLASPLEQSRGERRDRATCLFEASTPETRVELWFDASKQLRSSESKIELAGLGDVSLRVLEESAQLSIPFAAAKDASKMPADRIFIELELYRSNAVPTWDPAYRKPDPSALEAAVRELGSNAIQRLKLAP